MKIQWEHIGRKMRGDVVQDHDYPGENALYCMDFQGDMKKVG